MRTFSIFIFSIVFLQQAGAQTIGDFTSIPPLDQYQTPNFILPPTHTFQILMREGDSITLGGVAPDNFDFTGYVPTNGSSLDGIISLNHENTIGAVTTWKIHFDQSDFMWKVLSSGWVNLSTVLGVSRPCSGGITPWGTVIVTEEVFVSGDANSDGYNDYGWLTEIEPRTGNVVNQDGIWQPDKIWKAGRLPHENAAIKEDGSLFYSGSDHPYLGFLTKYVPVIPGYLGDGNLFVLKMDSGGQTGTWVQVPNDNQRSCNNTASYAVQFGATNFNGIEDVEFGPDGKIYFASKGHGRVYRFIDNGNSISSFETYVGGTSYEINFGSGRQTIDWGWGNDNLCFDGDGNLWVLQDGGFNHIWVVRNGHSQLNPKVELFGRTPAGCEPTGITFSPDYKYLFMSFMHPYNWNNISQPDCIGKQVKFNRDCAIVIARDENLGSSASVDYYSSFNLSSGNGKDVTLEWEILSANKGGKFFIEREQNGGLTETIEIVYVDKTRTHYSWTDFNPGPGTWFYKIRRELPDGQNQFTDKKSITLVVTEDFLVKVFPIPATDLLTVETYSRDAFEGEIMLSDPAGRILLKQNIQVFPGMKNTFEMDISDFAQGHYFLLMMSADQLRFQAQFVK